MRQLNFGLIRKTVAVADINFNCLMSFIISALNGAELTHSKTVNSLDLY
jgi:hypothetical protein